jgi:hypothetical protein
MAVPSEFRFGLVSKNGDESMFGGLLKSTSLAALVAVAGIAVTGVSAQAADLGGNCCADLEERIAELEATTARKGNRKVSLTVSGFVNEQVMFWDDGVESNAYQSTNEVARTRFRFLGSAKIDANWSAGYLLEIGVRGSNTKGQSANVDDGAAAGLDVRHSAWWINNKDLGKLWVGQTSSATDGITEVNLANTGHFTGAQIGDYIGGFAPVRSATGTRLGQTRNVLMNGLENPGEGTRFNVVKYETPTIAGFIASAAWGEDDVVDVALRYAGEFSGFKLAAGIGYAQWSDGNGAAPERGCSRNISAGANGSDSKCDELGLSASIMHVPTGLYVTGAYGYRNDDNRAKLANIVGTEKRDEFYYIQAGIEQKFFPVGKTTLFGEYLDGQYGAPVTTAAGGTSAAIAGPVAGSFITSVESKMWGVGFNQAIDAAALDIYVIYRNFETGVNTTAGAVALEDIQTITTGARIQF